MGDFLLSKFMFPMLLPGCGVLALAGLGCLLYGRGKEHRRLAWTAAVFLTALTLWIGGIFLMGFFDLTWRDAPAAALCAVLLVSGWVGIFQTLACLLPMEWKEVAPVLRWAVKGAVSLFAAVVFIVTLFFGPMAIGFIYSDAERVVTYEGRTLLEVDDGFMDPHYSYYEYHGPLVRGAGRIYDDHEPLHGK